MQSTPRMKDGTAPGASGRFRDMILRPEVARTLRAGLAAAGLASVLSFAGASDAEAQDPILFGQGGTYVGCPARSNGLCGYRTGSGASLSASSAMANSVHGFEGRVGGEFRDPWQPEMDPYFTTSAVARFGFIDLEPAIHVGGQAGAGVAWGSLVGELMLGYQWGEGGGFSLPLGLELDVFVATTFLRADPVLQSIAFGGGLIAPPRMSFPMAVAGRALHAEQGHAALPVVTPLDERRLASDVDRDLGAQLTAAWERRAQAEWASVPAFLQLADQLRVAGAPRRLVDRALAAAEDEHRHAVATARASMAYGGAPVRLGRVTPHTRPHAEGRDARIRLAVESWVDGCLGEGKAAAAVAREAELASIPQLAAMQRTIARDEARHAELAWDVMRWAVETGGDDVRHALAAARDASPTEGTSGLAGEVDLRSQGLLSEAEHAAIGDAVRERALPRLDRLLG